MNEDREQAKVFRIPTNYSGSGKILGLFRKRNLAEAAVVLLVFWMTIQAIPFTSNMKILLTVVVCLPLFVWFVFGINDESVTQYMYSWLIYKRNKKNARIILKEAAPEKQPAAEKKPQQQMDKKKKERKGRKVPGKKGA